MSNTKASAGEKYVDDIRDLRNVPHLQDLLRSVYNEGFDEGFDEGYNKGIDDGYKEAKKDSEIPF